MADTEFEQLQTAIQHYWSRVPSKKAQLYVNAFSGAERRGTKITAKVVGNHGAYSVSIQLDAQGLTSACTSELRHHYFKELSATKLACVGVRASGTNQTSVSA